MKLRFLKDPKTHQNSVTVTFVTISFLLSIISICLSLKFTSCLPASILGVLLFGLCMAFYRLRKLDSFSIDLKSGKIEASDKP